MDSGLTDDGYCFVCGADNPSGLKIEFRPVPDGVAADFSASREHQGYKNIVHGGIIASLLDEASVKAANAKGIKAVTAEIRLRYRSPLFINEHAIINAKIVAERGGIIDTEATIVRAADHKVVAESSARLFSNEG